MTRRLHYRTSYPAYPGAEHPVPRAPALLPVRVPPAAHPGPPCSPGRPPAGLGIPGECAPGGLDPRRLREQMVRRVEAALLARGMCAPDVLAAMGRVPRHLFVQEALRARAHEEQALPIGYGQTISQPSVVALMSAALELAPKMRVLEIGTGSGYQAAVLAAMGCKVYTVERIRELYAATSALLRGLGLRNVHCKRDDGTLGIPEAAPFERIIVTAGGPEIPRPLLAQLEHGGIMVIPVGSTPREQRLLRVRKRVGAPLIEDLGSAAFVDLVGNHGWQDGTPRR